MPSGGWIPPALRKGFAIAALKLNSKAASGRSGTAARSLILASYA